MTEENKLQIRSLRSQGYGYKKIASEMGISVNTVKSFCRNNKLTEIPSAAVCQACGKTIVQLPKQKQRKFCSAKCRDNWWNSTLQVFNKIISRSPFFRTFRV